MNEDRKQGDKEKHVENGERQENYGNDADRPERFVSDAEQSEEHATVIASYEPSKPRNSSGRSHVAEVWIGIGILMALHLLLVFVPIGVFMIGVVQVIYLVPALLFARRRKGVVQGMLIAAGITFLVNAACFGIVMGSLM